MNAAKLSMNELESVNGGSKNNHGLKQAGKILGGMNKRKSPWQSLAF